MTASQMYAQTMLNNSTIIDNRLEFASNHGQFSVEIDRNKLSDNKRASLLDEGYVLQEDLIVKKVRIIWSHIEDIKTDGKITFKPTKEVKSIANCITIKPSTPTLYDILNGNTFIGSIECNNPEELGIKLDEFIKEFGLEDFKKNSLQIGIDNNNHLQFIYDRLVNVHNENPNVDYMQKFKTIISKL